ncbi:unnamed protein product [Paramecium octaurelia]|uniref:Protein kinase domain-containing protein n=1 Tax=Paramecium octaurelia TaxID=43137 RepID=A0A8S1XHF5_PAROT|nr:unnamed protein product [Paramecium octaurelia]
MGQSTSSQSNPISSSFFKTFQSQFKPIDLKNEFKTGQIYVNDANQEMVIEFPYRVFNHESDEPWLKFQTMIKKIQAPYIIDYYGSIEKQSSEFCSTSTVISSYFEYIPQNLEKELKHRKQHSERFSEKELWYFLWSIANALYELKQKGYNHQDIRPATISLKSNGQIKLYPIGIIFDQENSINKFINNKTETYLPPSLKKQLQQNQQPKIQWNLIDSYALGKTLLDLMQLNDQKQLDEQQINELQNQCYNHYSIQLIRIMESLMAESVNQLTIDDVYYILKPYQNKILNFQDFVVNYEEVKQNALPLTNTLKCKSVIESFSYRYSQLSSFQQHQRTQSEIIYETQQYQQSPRQIETQQIKQQIQYQQANNIESQRFQQKFYSQNNYIEQNKLGNQSMFLQQKSEYQFQDPNFPQQQLQVTNQQPKLIQKLMLQSQLIPSSQQPIQQDTFSTTQISPNYQLAQTYNQTSTSIRSNPNVIVGPSPTILNQPIDATNVQTFQKQQQSPQIPLYPTTLQPQLPNMQIPIQRYPSQNQANDFVTPKREVQSRSIPLGAPNQNINGAIQTVDLPTIPIQQYNLTNPLLYTPNQPNNQMQNINAMNLPLNPITYSQVPNPYYVTPIQDHNLSNQPLKVSSQLSYQPQQPMQIKQDANENFKPQYNNFDRIRNILKDSEDLLIYSYKQYTYKFTHESLGFWTFTISFNVIIVFFLTLNCGPLKCVQFVISKQNALPLTNTLKCKSVIESFSYRYSQLSSFQQHQRTQSEIIYETQQYQQSPRQIETQQIKQQIQYQQANNIESQRFQQKFYSQNNYIEQNKLGNQSMFLQQKSEYQFQDPNFPQQQLQVTNQQPKLIQKLMLQSQLIPSSQQPIQQDTFSTTQISPNYQLAQTYNQTSTSIRSNPNVIVGPSPTILNQPIDATNVQTFQKQQQSPQIPLYPTTLQPQLPNMQIPIQRYPSQNQANDFVTPKREVQSRSIPLGAPNQNINGAIQTVDLPTIPIQQYNLTNPLLYTPNQPNNQMQNINAMNLPLNPITYSQVPNPYYVTPIQDHNLSNQPLKVSSQLSYQPQQPMQIKQDANENFKPQYNNFDRIRNILKDSEDLLQSINK